MSTIKHAWFNGMTFFFLASEYRAWTLLYCLPVLRGILDEEYLQHFVLFSEALWLLLQSVVSPEDITKAERMLQHFCFKFSAFYGTQINILLNMYFNYIQEIVTAQPMFMVSYT